MKINKNIWTGKNKPYNRNSLYFPNGVNSDSGGGDAPSGGESASTIEYLDVSGMNADNKSVLIMYALQLKLTGENVVLGTQITSHGMYSRAPMPSAVTAISIDVTMPMTKYVSSSQSDKQELTTLEEAGITIFTDNLPRLTKEQFYDLNA